MNEFSIIENGILITTSASGKNLYKTSKSVIKDNSKLIDENIRSIHICEKVKLIIAPINIQQKKEIIEFQNKQITFYELSSFFLHFSIDFSISCRELHLATNKPEQIFYIKSIYIELYRYLERHNKDLGVIRNLCEDKEKYKAHNIYLGNFRADYYKEIKTNRNKLFAHFDKENQYHNYFEFVSTLNTEQVAKMCSQFLYVQEKLLIILKEISENQKKKTIIISKLLKEKEEETGKAVQEKIRRIKDIINKQQNKNPKFNLNLGFSYAILI